MATINLESYQRIAEDGGAEPTQKIGLLKGADGRTRKCSIAKKIGCLILVAAVAFVAFLAIQHSSGCPGTESFNTALNQTRCHEVHLLP